MWVFPSSAPGSMKKASVLSLNSHSVLPTCEDCDKMSPQQQMNKNLSTHTGTPCHSMKPCVCFQEVKHCCQTRYRKWTTDQSPWKLGVEAKNTADLCTCLTGVCVCVCEIGETVVCRKTVTSERNKNSEKSNFYFSVFQNKLYFNCFFFGLLVLFTTFYFIWNMKTMSAVKSATMFPELPNFGPHPAQFKSFPPD